MTTKVVVAGGTGFLGRHISRSLMDAGYAVTVLGRNPDKVATIPELRGATVVRGDVTDATTLTGSLEGADAIVQVVQFSNYPMEDASKGLTFDNYDRGGAENLIAEAKRCGVSRFVYLSGAAADPSSERTWYRAKGLAERAIRSSGIDHAIIRPSWGYGPEDKALNRFATMARFLPVVPQPGVREQRIQPVYVGDIALAVTRVFERGAWNDTYEIGSREVMTMTEVVRTLLEVMGKRKPIVPIPIPLMKLATAPLVLLPAPPLSPRGVDFATQDGLVDITKMVEVLGVEPLSLRAGLAGYIAR